MSRKEKIIKISVIGFCLVVVFFSASTIRRIFLSFRDGHWPQVPPPELYVFTQPKSADIIGVYELTQQTITTNAWATLEGHPCELNLGADGSFVITNSPHWSSAAQPYVAGFISTTGNWRCEKINVNVNGKDCLGIVFSNTSGGIDNLALRSNGTPYDLMFTYGDGDDGAYLIFGKKK